MLMIWEAIGQGDRRGGDSRIARRVYTLGLCNKRGHSPQVVWSYAPRIRAPTRLPFLPAPCPMNERSGIESNRLTVVDNPLAGYIHAIDGCLTHGINNMAGGGGAG